MKLTISRHRLCQPFFGQMAINVGVEPIVSYDAADIKSADKLIPAGVGTAEGCDAQSAGT